jgi:dihydrolipoamide dehydrogenase
MVVGELTQETDLAVIGGGPGGYSAAFAAAQLGISTTIVESTPALGGVCLHVGCIPSKTLLAMAEVMHLADAAKQFGLEYAPPKVNLEAMRAWKKQVIDRLAKGLDSTCKKLNVERVRGKAVFENSRHLALAGGEVARIKFKRAIIATGSVPVRLRGIEIDSPRVVDSTGALELQDEPKRLLVIGGGYIGLELGSVYAALGSEVTVVEMLDSLLAGVDPDLVRPLAKKLEKQFAEICLKTKVTGMKNGDNAIEAIFEGENLPKAKTFERVLVAVGRKPNTADLGLSNTKAQLDQRGFIKVDEQLRTADPKIFAIGDAIGEPLLAHKAIHEGRVVAEVIAGKDVVYDRRAVPAVVFTDPEIAWCGLTETQAKAENIPYEVRKVQWPASGRAVSIGRTDGLTKLLFDPKTQRLLGMGLVGPHVGEMIAEGVLALEMAATATDIATAIHPHPTLSETIGDAAYAMLGGAAGH